jgi:spore maturation protein CgeB
MVNQLKNHPNQRAEEALEAVLEKKKITLTEHEFVVTLHKSLEAVRTVTFYIREKIIKTLIESGINVDVFGDSWKKSPYADNKNLIIHDDIDFEKGLDIMAQSRISLNVMSWHKGGMTERIANAMLNYSVCVTDETSYINRHFVAGENIVTFNLDNIDKLPDKIRTVLQDENLQKYIEKNAYKKALSEHTWDNRSGYFMNILGEIEK